MSISLSLRAATRFVACLGLFTGCVLSWGAELAEPVKVGGEEGHYHVYVSNERAGDISIIDSKTHDVVRTIIAGKRPRGVHVSPDGQMLYVATSASPRTEPGADQRGTPSPVVDRSADGIAVIDLVTGKRIKQLQVGADPEEFALSRDGKRVIVANADVAEMSIWEIETGRQIARTRVSAEPEGVKLHPTRDEVYVTCGTSGEVFVLNPNDGRQIARIELGGRSRALVFSADGTRAYVPLKTKPEIAIIDVATHTVVETVRVPPPASPTEAAISGDGREVYVTTGREGNGVVVLDTETRKIVEAVPAGTRPCGIALTPDGTHLFTANGGSNDVSVINVKSRKEVARVPVGGRPWGVAIGPVIVP